MSLTPERRAASLARLEATYKKWADCQYQMVGTLYPGIVEARYLRPLRRKISELRYAPRLSGHTLYVYAGKRP